MQQQYGLHVVFFSRKTKRENVLIDFATISDTSCERIFSKLPIVKSKLRSTTFQERLESLVLLFVEQENVMNIQVEEVIVELKTMNNERAQILVLQFYKLGVLTNEYLKIT